jgi:hypothetical protein
LFASISFRLHCGMVVASRLVPNLQANDLGVFEGSRTAGICACAGAQEQKEATSTSQSPQAPRIASRPLNA